MGSTTKLDASNTAKYVKNVEGIKSKMSKGRVVVLVWAEWCPHCVVMKPTWDKVRRDASMSGVHFVEVESRTVGYLKEHDPDLHRQFSNNGAVLYPTITIVTNNKGKKFKSERSFDNMKTAFAPPPKPKAKETKAKTAAKKA